LSSLSVASGPFVAATGVVTPLGRSRCRPARDEGRMLTEAGAVLQRCTDVKVGGAAGRDVARRAASPSHEGHDVRFWPNSRPVLDWPAESVTVNDPPVGVVRAKPVCWTTRTT